MKNRNGRRVLCAILCLLLPACGTATHANKIGYAIEDSLLAILLTEAPLVGYRECLVGNGITESALKDGTFYANYQLTFQFEEAGPRLAEFTVNLGSATAQLEAASCKCIAFVLNIKAGEYPAAVNHASAAAWSALPKALQHKLPKADKIAEASFARLRGKAIFARGSLFPKTNAQIWDSTDQLHMNMGDVLLKATPASSN